MRPLELQIESGAARHTALIPPERAREDLPSALRRLGFPLNTRCGGRGLCDGCIVELLDGRLTHIASNAPVEAAGQPLRIKACQHRLDGHGPVRLRIAARSLLAYQPQIVTDYRINVSCAHDPLVQHITVRRGGSSPQRWSADALIAAVAAARDDGRPVRLADSAAVPGGDEATVTVEYRPDGWLITAARDASAPLLGVAVDVGTTTVALLLVDLHTGRTLARAAAFNAQMALGDDVITRITLCMHDPAMVRRLQDAVAARTIAPLLRTALGDAGAAPENVRCIVVAGNTTMLHLLAGVDPSPLGVVPFTPVFRDHRVLKAADIFGQDCSDICSPAAAVHLLPSASAYVGADLTAGMIATGLAYDEGPCLLVDAGTNGEIILKHRDRLLGCATAAGPAFEGTGLACGMRAGEGAIIRITMRDRPFTVDAVWIGQERSVRPAGLCGSAYVDFLAEGRRIGLLSPPGRFNTEIVADDGERLTRWNGTDLALRIAGDRTSPVFITQGDVSKLLQAKAAIAAGILTLLARAGLAPQDVRKVYLAGGFGTSMSPANAAACGLLPGFAPARIEPVGNTSLAGALLALLDSGMAAELSTVARTVEIVELNLDPGFEDRYIDNMCLP